MLVYAATCQLPQLTMAPYIGNLFEMGTNLKYNIRGKIQHLRNSSGGNKFQDKSITGIKQHNLKYNIRGKV